MWQRIPGTQFALLESSTGLNCLNVQLLDSSPRARTFTGSGVAAIAFTTSAMRSGPNQRVSICTFLA
jgi:hypothetical protein